MPTLREAATRTRTILYRSNNHAVFHTVAEAWLSTLAPNASVRTLDAVPEEDTEGQFCIEILSDAPGTPPNRPWMSLRLDEHGTGRLRASHPQWLYAITACACDEWRDREIGAFTSGVLLSPSFPWLRNLSDFLVGSLRSAKSFHPELYFRQIARQGFSHVTVNGLGVPRPFESSPPGDVYFWFYDYSPDLDQFVDSTLLRGYYPPDYLSANLAFLKESAALARRYGLVPGLHINSPRSMPEEFWSRYGFLRGARIDHPRETRRPRYTLAMAHPVVQQHYRELIRNIMREIPDLGFIHIWTNDSGAGFEFVTSLYAGRNGGAYLLREWKSDEEIAQKAGVNVLTYYQLLHNEARTVNPDFRLVCDLGPFYAERKYIVPGLGDGIDAGEFAYFESPRAGDDRRALAEGGVETHVKLDLSDNNIIGVPYPGLVYERLTQARREGIGFVLAGVNPNCLAPFDINGEVIRSVQLFPERLLDEILTAAAVRWVGADYAQALVHIWRTVDAAVRSYPADIPMSTFGFPWFRLWVRPFVPNIDAITEVDRKYYEDFLCATFNNPAHVDLNNDMMWNFKTVEEAGIRKRTLDSEVLPRLESAMHDVERVLHGASASSGARRVFQDLHSRIVGYACYCMTMRNTMAWTESVHGYLRSTTDGDRSKYRSMCTAMVDAELANTARLLALWREGDVTFMPVSSRGETMHIYGENFGELLEKKILLMERHRNDEPYIDPGYMWRMP